MVLCLCSTSFLHVLTVNTHAKYSSQCLWTKQYVVTKQSKGTSVSVRIVVSTNAPELFLCKTVRERLSISWLQSQLNFFVIPSRAIACKYTSTYG